MQSSPQRTGAPVARMIALADQCVKCGRCLPHCPSYRVRAEEGQSPRGRIAYARALALGTLAPSPAVTSHLDGCLACGSCEIVCPSRVAFLDLLVGTRSNAPRGRAARTIARLARLLARRRSAWRLLRRMRFVGSFARWLPRASRLAAALEATGGLADPAASTAAKPVPVPSRGRIAVFRGCIASV